jgi:hypothetical protein
LLAAVAWGADPEDPRLHAASERILDHAEGDGGLVGRPGGRLDAILTARALETMTALGWGSHPRVHEWLAWFEELSGWESDPRIAVPVLAAVGRGSRRALRSRAADGISRSLVRSRGNNFAVFGHPNLRTVDLAEIFFVLASAEVGWRPEWRRLLKKLQNRQNSDGRWERKNPVPRTLGIAQPVPPSRWVTLKATRGLLAYAVDAGLPRLFPYPPSAKQPRSG